MNGKRKRYNHAVSIAFSVDSDSPDDPTVEEIRAAFNALPDGDVNEMFATADIFDTIDRNEDDDE